MPQTGDEAAGWARLIELLGEVYDDQGIAIWLRAGQQCWGKRYHGWQDWLDRASVGFAYSEEYLSALDVIADGRMDEVLTAAEALVTGG